MAIDRPWQEGPGVQSGPVGRNLTVGGRALKSAAPRHRDRLSLASPYADIGGIGGLVGLGTNHLQYCGSMTAGGTRSARWCYTTQAVREAMG